ncbi:MAG: head morphogenesis protein [Burkholderiaceae bacterium]|nr:head morphogenesis protein [Burkholderiaceae bacterium]
MPGAIGIGFPGKDAAGNHVSTPFDEQIDFFRRKLNLPTERWDDIVKSAHDRVFIVAGAANADLLNDLNGAIRKAKEEGRGLEAFRKDFNAIVLKHGWTGWTGEGSAAGQAWRTRVIYQTNMATSYAAGRWQQLKHPDLLKLRPYWRYVHADGVMHPRPLHVSWHGLVLPHDHPFWDTHFPPNGWGCHCRVTAVDAREYAAAQDEGRAEPPAGWDKLDPKTQAPVGIDKGFDYAPGASAARPLKEMVDDKLIKLDAPVGAKMYEALRPALKAERDAAYKSYLDEVLADPVKRGRTAVIGAIDPATLEWLAKKGIHPATAEITVQDGLIIGKKAARHQAAGDALSAAEWASLPALIDSPGQVLFDTKSGKLLYVAASGGAQAKLAVEFDYKMKKGHGETNMLVLAFRVLKDAITAGIKGGIYALVR